MAVILVTGRLLPPCARPFFSSAMAMSVVLSGLWLMYPVLTQGLSSCALSVSVQDLGCCLHWNCPDVNPSTVFTVQTKTQGKDWQKVSNCVGIFANSCDVSEAVTDFDLYNFIRLGLSHSDEQLRWTEPVSCDPLKEPNRRFSPPSLSISLEERRLQVEVAFPSAPAAACCEEEEEEKEEEEEEEEEECAGSCCHVICFLELNTTVRLYNRHDVSDAQTRTELVQKGGHFRAEFGWLTPGQEYCAVASFTSSPLSSPECVQVPAQESLNLFALGLCGMFILLIGLLTVVCWLAARWASSDTVLPKPLLSLQSLNQEEQFESEPGRASLEEENFVVNHLSIISLSSMVVSESSVQECSSSLGVGYYTSPVLQHHGSPGDHQDSGGLDTDGGLSPAEGPEAVRPWEPDVNVGFPEIPLSSVRLAAAQEEDAELLHLPSLVLNLSVDHHTPALAARDQGGQNMSSELELQGL